MLIFIVLQVAFRVVKFIKFPRIDFFSLELQAKNVAKVYAESKAASIFIEVSRVCGRVGFGLGVTG